MTTSNYDSNMFANSLKYRLEKEDLNTMKKIQMKQDYEDCKRNPFVLSGGIENRGGFGSRESANSYNRKSSNTEVLLENFHSSVKKCADSFDNANLSIGTNQSYKNQPGISYNKSSLDFGSINAKNEPYSFIKSYNEDLSKKKEYMSRAAFGVNFKTPKK